MRRPLISLFVSIAFFILAGMFVSPLTRPSHRVVIGPEGRTVHPKTEEEIRADRVKVLRANGPAHVCFTVGALSFGWTLFLVSYGIVTVIRTRRPPSVPEETA